MSAEAAWLIAKSGAIAPPTGSIHRASYLVRVMRRSSRREVIVEFPDSSAVVSNGYAEEVTRRFLRDDEPPQHIIVEAAGTVRDESARARPSMATKATRASPRARRAPGGARQPDRLEDPTTVGCAADAASPTAPEGSPMNVTMLSLAPHTRRRA
jgi:hypothetical protein